jgi:SRSO17 transposase
MGRIAGRFARVEPRRRARAFVLGLVSELRRKNCWTIAEQAGDATPDGMQHLLAGARWDADAVRDDVRGYVVEHLGSPDAVLVVDETGDLYLPRSWTADPPRCAAAGIPEGTAFATKPKLARRMISRALDAGVPASWVTAD